MAGTSLVAKTAAMLKKTVTRRRVYHKLKPLWDGKEVDEDKLTPAEKGIIQNLSPRQRKTVGRVNQEEMAFIKHDAQVPAGSILRKELGKRRI